MAEFQPFPPNKETRCRVLSFQPLARQSQSSTGQNRDQAFPMSLCSDCSSSHNKRRKTRIKGRRSHPALPNPRERLRKDGVALRQGLCLPCTFASLATNLGISFCKAKNGVTRLEKLPPSQTPRYRHLPFPYALRMRELTAPLLWLNAFSLMWSLLEPVYTSTKQSVHKISLLDMILKLTWTETCPHFIYRRTEETLGSLILVTLISNHFF